MRKNWPVCCNLFPNMRIYEYISRIRRALILGIFCLFVPLSNYAAELLMIEEPGCIYCDRFNREIAPAYPKTSEGRKAPLRRLQLDEPFPAEFANVRAATVTPTFILVNEGREIDRLIGYPGDEYFWFLLGEMLEKL